MRRGRYTNDPMIIAQQDNMVSINAALQIDLTGQVAAEAIANIQWSGTGGARTMPMVHSIPRVERVSLR